LPISGSENDENDLRTGDLRVIAPVFVE